MLTIAGKATFHGAGVLPYAKHKGKTYFLIGKEKSKGGWCDFGGTREKNEKKPIITAARECNEEMRKIISKGEIRKNLGQENLLKISNKSSMKSPLSNYIMYLSDCTNLLNKNKLNLKKTIKKFSKSHPKAPHCMEKDAATWIRADKLFLAIRNTKKASNVFIKDFNNKTVKLTSFFAKSLSIAVPPQNSKAKVNSVFEKIVSGQALKNRFNDLQGTPKIFA